MANPKHANWVNVRLHAARKHANRCRLIEDAVKHRVSISTSMPSDDRVNRQSSSPLFRLSAEIRLMIYQMAFNYDDTIGFSKAADGGPAPYGSFLLTCRMVWIEANMLPMAVSTHTFNFAHGSKKSSGTAAPIHVHQTHQAEIKKSQREGLAMQKFFTRLTPLNRIDITDVVMNVNHITLASWCDKENLTNMLGANYIYTKCLTLRISDADWGPLKQKPVEEMDFSWLKNLFKGNHLIYVQSFKLELEIEFTGDPEVRGADRAHILATAKRFSQIDGLHPDDAPIVVNRSVSEGKDSFRVDHNYCTITLNWTNTQQRPRQELEHRAVSYQIGEHLLDQKFKPVKRRGGGERSHIVINRERKKKFAQMQKEALLEEERNHNLWRKRMADQQVRLQLKEWDEKGSLMALCNAAYW